MKHLRTIAVAGILAGAVLPALAMDISGAGATFPYPIYAKWADAYKKETGVGLNYQSIGSGGGIKQIEARTVTFGATDAPLKGDDLDKNGLVQFPMVMGGIVPVVNLAGIKAGDLVIDGPTLANIFLGNIKTWDDPAIKKLNPSAKLPSQAIAVVHRSDGSGTTFNFAYYLAQVSADWKDKVGFNTSVEWPVGIGAKGNEGVSQNVSQTNGAIGYVEYAYALQNKMTYTKMINKDGKTVIADQRRLPGSRCECGLEFCAGLRRDSGQSTRRHVMADDGRDVHPHPQTAAGRGRRRRGAQVLRLGLCQGRQDGRGTRLRADAQQGCRHNRGHVGEVDHRHERKAAPRHVELIPVAASGHATGQGTRSRCLVAFARIAATAVVRRAAGKPDE